MKGHLRRRGEAWELRAYAGRDPVTKRQTYVTRTFRGGKRDAEDALSRLVAQVSGGGHSSQDTTVGDLIRQWLELSAPELSPSTARGYAWIVRAYVLPVLGDVPLSRLRTAQLDRFYSQLRLSGGKDGSSLSPATVRQVHAITRRALQQGVRWGWITTNPATLASPPRVTPPPLVPPTAADVVRLIEVASAKDRDLGCFLHLAATSGARRGELCALRWTDIDMDAGTLTITRSIVEATHSVLVEKDTKTHGSRRIALDEGTLSALTEHHASRAAAGSSCGAAYTQHSFLFSRAADGSVPWPPNDVTKAFVRVRDTIGMTTRLHDLRHFSATYLLAAGVPVRTVSGRLGHSNAATTLGVYGHFLEASDREAAATLGALIKPSKTTAVRPATRQSKAPGSRLSPS